MIDWKCTLQRWVWWCPYAMLGLAIAILLLFGLSFWTALLIAMLLVCPGGDCAGSDSGMAPQAAKDRRWMNRCRGEQCISW